MTMTKKDIVLNINEKIGIPQKESAKLVESLFEIMKGELVSGGKGKIAAWIPFIVLGNALLCLVFFLSSKWGVVSYLLAALAIGFFLSLFLN